MIGFSKGYFNIVSTNPSNMGTELFQVRDYRSSDLSGVAVCPALGLCGTISGVRSVGRSNTIQYNTILCGTNSGVRSVGRSNTIQYNTIRCNAISGVRSVAIN